MVKLVKIVTYKNRIYVPKDLRTMIMKYYYHYLYHPGEGRMPKILGLTLYWKIMEDEIRQFVKKSIVK